MGLLLTAAPARAQQQENTAEEELVSPSPSRFQDVPSGERHRLSDRAELDLVVELYMVGKYEECSAELQFYLDPTNTNRFRDADVIEKGRLYYSTCSLLLGKREKARAALLTALQENPLMQSPDSLTFPPPLVSLFLEVRDEVQQLISDREREQVAELRRENEQARRRAEERLRRERELEKLAQEEVVVAKNSRFIAVIPYGAGQFQNGKKGLGTFFLVSEGLATATALTSGIILSVLQGQERRQGCTTPECIEPYNNGTAAAYQTLKWSSWATLGLAALGILEAQWFFKPERQLAIRKRELPKDLRFVPNPEEAEEGTDTYLESRDQPSSPRQREVSWMATAAAVPGGGVLGVGAQF
jgi:hypothetical protein